LRPYGQPNQQPQHTMNKRCSKSLLSLLAFCAGLCLVAPPVSGQSRPVLSVQVSNALVRLKITGDVGSACTIQYSTGISRTNNWQFVTNLTPLLSSPYSVVDAGATLPVSRFYRAFSQQLPASVVPVTNMLWISPGTFVMGSPTNEALRFSEENQHTVTLTKGFYMGKYPVTQGQYLSVLNTNPSYFTPNHGFSLDLGRPIELVSWTDATNYCAKLTQQELTAGRLPAGWVYRLPTEAEWEYTCRAGTTTAFHYGSALRSGMANFDGTQEYDASLGEIVNASGIRLGLTTTVGSYQPNAWGLYDVHGNVQEWCQDLYGDYSTGSVIDPPGAVSGDSRVYRGGCWDFAGRFCRSAGRYSDLPSTAYTDLGFRVVLAQGQP
jgi:formylglycine-generating enzyme required for sulfatase activity